MYVTKVGELETEVALTLEPEPEPHDAEEGGDSISEGVPPDGRLEANDTDDASSVSSFTSGTAPFAPATGRAAEGLEADRQLSLDGPTENHAAPPPASLTSGGADGAEQEEDELLVLSKELDSMAAEVMSGQPGGSSGDDSDLLEALERDVAALVADDTGGDVDVVPLGDI